MQKRLFYLFASILLFSSCDSSSTDGNWGVTVYNRSLSNIVVCGSYILPDTLLPKSNFSTIVVEKNKRGVLEDHMLNDKDMKRFEKQKLSVFVIDEEIYKNESWDTIRKYNKVLKRYELNLQDYRNMGNEVIYP